MDETIQGVEKGKTKIIHLRFAYKECFGNGFKAIVLIKPVNKLDRNHGTVDVSTQTKGMNHSLEVFMLTKNVWK